MVTDHWSVRSGDQLIRVGSIGLDRSCYHSYYIREALMYHVFFLHFLSGLRPPPPFFFDNDVADLSRGLLKKFVNVCCNKIRHNIYPEIVKICPQFVTILLSKGLFISSLCAKKPPYLYKISMCSTPPPLLLRQC